MQCFPTITKYERIKSPGQKIFQICREKQFFLLNFSLASRINYVRCSFHRVFRELFLPRYIKSQGHVRYSVKLSFNLDKIYGIKEYQKNSKTTESNVNIV